MNRPLFFTVVMFALGEVTYMIADKSTKGGILFCMLLCCAFFVVKLRGYRVRCIFFGLAVIFGYFRAEVFCNQGVIGMLYSQNESQRIDRRGDYEVRFNSDYLGIKREAVLEGIVVDVTSGNSGKNITVHINEGNIDKWQVDDSFRIIVYGVDCSYGECDIGNTVMLKGMVNGFDKATNPGSFDMRNYYFAKKIMGYMYGSDTEVYIEDVRLSGIKEKYYLYKRCLFEIRNALSERFYRLVEIEYGGLFDGILLGEKDNISKEINMLYRVNGISHILAISGLHISLIGMGVYKLLRRFRMKFLPAGILSFVFVFSYGIMTGMSFATMRAVVMFGIYLGSQITGRRNDMLTSLSVALIILAVGSPYRILDKGVWLSFCAMLGVYISGYVLKNFFNYTKLRRLKMKKKRKLRKLLSSLLGSFGVTIITAPIIALTYYQIPLYSPIINLIVIPLMTIVAISGIAGLALSFVSMWLGRVALIPGKMILVFYERLCNWFSTMPIALINTGTPKGLEVSLYYVVIFLVLILINHRVKIMLRDYIHRRTNQWLEYKTIFSLSVVGIIFTFSMGITGIVLVRFCGREEQMVFLDVGQGDGIFIKTGCGTNMVIDCGSAFSDIGEYTMVPALLSMNMGKVDYWFISHFDKDHTSGFQYILQEGDRFGIHIENIVVGEEMIWDESVTDMLDMAFDKGIGVIYMSAGDCVAGKEFCIKCEYPYEGLDIESKNDGSLVLDYTSMNIDVVFLGDISSEVEKILPERTEKADIVKLAHHGSKYSTSYEILYKLEPDIGIISCGKDNSYGHPHADVLTRLEKTGVRYFRTDYNGAIYIDMK